MTAGAGTRVVVERIFDPPVMGEELMAIGARGGWCLEQHDVRRLVTQLSPDGRRCVCVYDAPDAEAVRIVNRKLAVPFVRAWPATVHEPPVPVPAPATIVVVERAFSEPVVFAEVQALEDAHASCMDLHRVRFVRTYFATDRRRMLCLYEAPDAEAVRLVQRQAALPFERAWTADRLGL